LKSKNLKVEEAQERLEHWRALAPAEQLAELDRRRYQGVAPTRAVRQRKRIAARLDAATHATVPPEKTRKKTQKA
jgi:hypothetical protein